MGYMVGMAKEFLYNKKNVIGLVVILNFLIGFILWNVGLTTIQAIVVIFLLFLSNMLVYTLGISQGIITMEILQTFYKTVKEKRKDKKKD